MNIFVTSECPIECARNLDDKRVVKMILESAQLLSTAVRAYAPSLADSLGLYKSTHLHHPCTKWVAESGANYLWLVSHMSALCHEYTKRYGKHHKCERMLTYFRIAYAVLPKTGRTAFPNCAANKSLGLDYKHMDDVCMAYQLYLADRWDTDKRTPTWGGA